MYLTDISWNGSSVFCFRKQKSNCLGNKLKHINSQSYWVWPHVLLVQGLDHPHLFHPLLALGKLVAGAEGIACTVVMQVRQLQLQGNEIIPFFFCEQSSARARGRKDERVPFPLLPTAAQLAQLLIHTSPSTLAINFHEIRKGWGGESWTISNFHQWFTGYKPLFRGLHPMLVFHFGEASVQSPPSHERPPHWIAVFMKIPKYSIQGEWQTIAGGVEILFQIQLPVCWIHYNIVLHANSTAQLNQLSKRKIVIKIN